jgi:hypothetical protein
MGPFNTTVFRVRLLLLAAAIVLMGVGGDKKGAEVVQSVKPIKAQTAKRSEQATANIAAGEGPAKPATLTGSAVRLR